MKHCAKFDSASFILAGEIRNRTNTHTKQTNKQNNKQKHYTIYPRLAYRHVWIKVVNKLQS